MIEEQQNIDLAEEPRLIRAPSQGVQEVAEEQPAQENLPEAPVVVEEEQIETVEYGPEAPSTDDFCEKTHKLCGHKCGGVTAERRCLPCMEPECAPEGQLTKADSCVICMCDLGDGACAKLGCGHIFHATCLSQLLQNGQPTTRLTFGYLDCPSCRTAPIDVFYIEVVAKVLRPIILLKNSVQKQALESARLQGILADGRVDDPADHYFGKPLEYAMHRCSFYQCYECKKGYFGGLIDCQQEAAQGEADPTQKEDLRCNDCTLKSIGAGKTTCETHGNVQIDWKCQFCCSVALFCCFGTHYFCDPCHNEAIRLWPRLENIATQACNGADCPLGIAHPPPTHDPKKGGVFPLGCGICRSENLEKLQKANATKQIAFKAEDLPKAYIYNQPNGEAPPQIIRPDIELEVPEFVAIAEEIEEVKLFMIDRLDTSKVQPMEVAKHTQEERESLQPKPLPDAFQFHNRRTIFNRNTKGQRVFNLPPNVRNIAKPLNRRQRA